VRWLRIAIGFFVSLLTALLVLLPAHAAQGSSWSVLSDPQGTLQISDVHSSRFATQFSPIELDQLKAAEPGEALWLRFRLVPDKHEQILRVFAPDVSRLDLYVLDDQKLIEEVTAGNTLTQADKPLPSSDYMLPCPKAVARWMSICGWSPTISYGPTSPSTPLSCWRPIRPNPCSTACCWVAC
jgi:two-component system, sensor histidine kinase RetS